METAPSGLFVPLLSVAVSAVIAYVVVSLFERRRADRLDRFVPVLLVLVPAVLLQFTAFAVGHDLVPAKVYVGALLLYFLIPLTLLRLFFRRSWARSAVYAAVVLVVVVTVHILLSLVLLDQRLV